MEATKNVLRYWSGSQVSNEPSKNEQLAVAAGALALVAIAGALIYTNSWGQRRVTDLTRRLTLADAAQINKEFHQQAVAAGRDLIDCRLADLLDPKVAIDDVLWWEDVIGYGMHGDVSIWTDASGNAFAIKEYYIFSEQVLDAIEATGLDHHLVLTEMASREYEIGLLLNHPNIIKPLELVLKDDLYNDRGLIPTLVMELAEGQTLGDLILQGEPLGSSDAKHYLTQFLSALEHMAQEGVTWSDLHPWNIIISPEGDLQLVDLGGFKVQPYDDFTAWCQVEELYDICTWLAGAAGLDASFVSQMESALYNGVGPAYTSSQYQSRLIDFIQGLAAIVDQS